MKAPTEKEMDITNDTLANDDGYNSKLTKVFINRNLFQCYHNNRGYCRFRDKCRFQHFKQICPQSICRDQECKYRHPRTCKFRECCKFQEMDICAFKHVPLVKQDITENVIKTHNEDIEKMKCEILVLKNNVQSKENELAKLSAKQDTKEIIIDGLKDYIKELEEDKRNLKTEISKLHSRNCVVCDCRFTSDSELNTHIKTHLRKQQPEPNKLQCKTCDFKAKSAQGLKTHTRVKHDNDQQEGISISCDNQCEQCNFNCETDNELKEHTESVHEEIGFICEEFHCEFTTKFEISLKEHINQKHGLLFCDKCDDFEWEWDEEDALETHKELYHED